MTQSEAQDSKLSVKEYTRQRMDGLSQQLKGIGQKVEDLTTEIREHKTYVVRWLVSLFIVFSSIAVSILTWGAMSAL